MKENEMHEKKRDIGPTSFLILNQLKTEQIISVYTEYVLMPLTPSFYYKSIQYMYYDF